MKNWGGGGGEGDCDTRLPPGSSSMGGSVAYTLQKILVKTTQNFGSKRCNSNNPFFWLIHPPKFVSRNDC